MDPKKISLIIVGVIWFLVGIGLSVRGINWELSLGSWPKLLAFLSCSVILGLLKGKFILSKVAAKYLKRIETVKFNKNDILFGWAKVLGIRGFIFIALMIALGVYLRHSNIDRPILGIIYLAVGIALVYASKIFFGAK